MSKLTNDNSVISVIIPIYNVEKYLPKCLDSVINNSYKNLEIICIDDGSPDNCGVILDKYSEKDKRIEVIHQENQGVAAARNNGISIARGDYIAFIDPDDWIHPQYFEILLRCMKKRNADIAVCGCEKFTEDNEIIPTRINKIRFSKLSAERFNKSYYARHMVWGRLYRRKDVENTHFISDVQIAEDTLYNLSVISEIKEPVVYETNVPLYYYLQRPNSIVNTMKIDKMIGFAEWYVIHGRESQKTLLGSWGWIRLLQAIKLTLSYRYGVLILKDYTGLKNANRLLRIMIIDMLRNRNVSLKNKVIHSIMFFSPSMYRCFRLKDDPTLRIWEHSIKRFE